MTVPTTINENIHNGNNSATVFPYEFRILAETDLKVYVDSGAGLVLQALTTDYTVSGVDDVAGGDVTFVTAPPSGTANVVIQRVVQLTQETDYLENDGFPAETHERALDKLTMIVQKHASELSRAVMVAINSGQDPDTLIASLLQASTDAVAAAAAAATSETNAATSETNAAASAAAAAAVLAGAILANGTVAMAADLPFNAGFGILFEGTTADAFETRLLAGEPTADRTVSLPDATTTLAGLDVTQTYSLPQRAGNTTDNDGSFDMSAKQDFVCTPTGGITLQFTNEANGQSGRILLNNTANYAIAFGSEVEIDSNAATALSATGKYRLDYWCYDGTNVAITYSNALS